MADEEASARSLFGRTRSLALGRAAGVIVGEALLALILPVLAYLWLHPVAARGIARGIWFPEGEPYRMGDLWGTLFMVQRSTYGESGCDTMLYSWPQGQNICNHFPNPLVTDLVALFVRFFGMPLGYNLGALASVGSTGVAVWMAVRLFGGARFGAWAGAALIGFLPMLHLEIFAGRPVTAWWAPPIAAAALGLACLDSWRRFALLIPGLFALVVALYVYPYGVVMLAPWVVAGAGAALLRGPERWSTLGRGAIALLAALALTWWVAQDAYGAVVNELHYGDPLRDREAHWGLLTRPGRPWQGPSIILGELVLVALVVARAPFSRWFPLLIGVVALVALGLGPNPLGDPGKEPPDPNAPFTWMIQNIRLMRGCSRPERFVLAAALISPIIVGLGLGSPARFVRGIGALATLAAMIWLKIYAGNVGPARLLSWPPLDGAEVMDGGVVLELPLLFPYDEQAHMLGQALYVAPRLNDNYPKANRWIDSIMPGWTVLFAAKQLQAGGLVPQSLFDSIAAGERERSEDLRWVMVHRALLPAMSPGLYDPLLQALDAKEVHRTRDLVIYQVEPPG